MDHSHADQLFRAAKALRSSLLVVLQHVDHLCELIEARGAEDCNDRAQRGRPSPTTRPDSSLRVERATLTVSWKDKECYLGYTLPFRLLERLAQRPNQFVRTDRLMEELWMGIRAPSTIRSAVSQLRLKLIAADMCELAHAIDGSNPGHYGLMLSRCESKSNTNPTAVRR